MKLFLGAKCPQCEALKVRVDLAQVPGLEVYQIPASGIPGGQDDVRALAEADFHGIQSVPALVSDGRTVQDVFDILEALKGAIAIGERDEG